MLSGVWNIIDDIAANWVGDIHLIVIYYLATVPYKRTVE